jgi:cytochrome c biogenesis protein CcmG, thiol:disulfide interchange protein DsbE
MRHRYRCWIAVVCAVGLAAFASASPVPRVGDPAPALVAPTADGPPIDLAALRGRVVILNLWASWCPPCRAELPMLSQFQTTHRDDGVVVVALSADRHRDRGDALAAIKGLRFTTAFMDGAKPNGYANPDALPFTYVIDRDGVIRAVFTPGRGALDAPALAAAIEPLLSAAR